MKTRSGQLRLAALWINALVAGCHSPYQRTGLPDALLNRTCNVVCMPILTVDVFHGATAGGSFFGIAGSAVGQAIDRNRNEALYAQLVEEGLEELMVGALEDTLRPALRSVRGLNIGDFVRIESIEKAVGAEANGSAATDPPRDSLTAVALARLTGGLDDRANCVLVLTLRFESEQSPGPPLVWEDSFVSESTTTLIQDLEREAPHLIQACFHQIAPWVRAELAARPGWLTERSTLRVRLVGGGSFAGHVLFRDRDEVVLRGFEGMTRVIPWRHVRSEEYGIPAPNESPPEPAVPSANSE